MLQAIPAADRAGLVNDAFTLASSGYLDYTVTLSFIEYMSGEIHYVPWSAAYDSLFELKNLVDNDKWNVSVPS